MQRVSNAYKEIMSRPIRNNMYMIVSLGIVNNESQKSAKIRGNYSYWSDSLSLFNNKAVSGRYATMEQNFFKADGSMLFLPENNMYAQFINIRGVCTEDILGSIVVEFGNYYDIKGLTIEFGEVYPTEFIIETNSNTFTFTNDLQKFDTNETFGETNILKITPVAMIGGQQRFRINKILMGVGLSFSNDDITASSKRETVSPVAEELPSIDFSLTVADDENIFNVDDNNSFVNYLETGQPISLSMALEMDDGRLETLELMNAYLSDWKSTKGSMSFSASDIFAFMDDVYVGGNTIHERTLYDDAIEVLTAFGLETDQYVIDECLKDVVVKNPLPEVSYAACLQLIANAGRCILYQDINGRICIKANFANVLDPDELVVTAKGESAWSNSQNILTGSDYVYADMTQNFFSTDGSMYFMPEDDSYLGTGFVSNEVADSAGEFKTNPKITIELPAGYVYYSIFVNFDGNPPEEMLVQTYNDGALQEIITFTDLEKENILNHEFKIFDKMEFEFTKASPNNRVLVNRISFGDLTDYTLTRDCMLEEPVGYRERKTKSVSVRIFSFECDDTGKVNQLDDSKFYTLQINHMGTAVTFENQLIGTQEHAQQIAEWLGNYYANNVSYEVKYRGEPRLNAPDIIRMESEVLNNLQVEVTSHELSFDGALSGKVELRRALRMVGG